MHVRPLQVYMAKFSERLQDAITQTVLHVRILHFANYFACNNHAVKNIINILGGVKIIYVYIRKIELRIKKK